MRSIDYFKKSYSKYHSTISLNKNLLLSGLVGLFFSIVAAYLFAIVSPGIYLNSIVTVLSGFLSYKIFFAFLIHKDNNIIDWKNTNGRIDFRKFKRTFLRILVASSIFDIVNNVTRFILIIELLKLDFTAIESAFFSSIIASVLSYGIFNVLIKYIHIFRLKK